MGRGGGAGGQRALKFETVRGEPYSVGERELIPVVRIVSFGKARATIGTRQSGGRAVGFVWIKPLAVLVADAEGERRIPITDATASAVYRLLGLALALTFFFSAVRWLGRRLRRSVHAA